MDKDVLQTNFMGPCLSSGEREKIRKITCDIAPVDLLYDFGLENHDMLKPD